MSRIYTDYLNETTLTIPDKFIDVKTGESYIVSDNIHEQIRYHAKNNTLKHLVFSALNHYLQPKISQIDGSREIMIELLALKKMLQQGSFMYKKDPIVDLSPESKKEVSAELSIKDIQEILEAFGG
jgi:hypothetical protein